MLDLAFVVYKGEEGIDQELSGFVAGLVGEDEADAHLVAVWFFCDHQYYIIKLGIQLLTDFTKGDNNIDDHLSAQNCQLQVL